MVQPLVSFIIPVYRAEKYLDRCVQSILNQKVSDWEIILVDDESPDQSGVMCEDYAKRDSRIRVIHRKNGGQGAARNTGAKEATGKWLMFVDDDDWLDENMAEECVEYLNEDIDILVFSRKDVYKKNSKERKLNLLTDKLCFETTEEKHMLQINMLNFFAPDKYGLNKVLFAVPWGKFFRRIFWQRNQLSFVEGYGEDRPCLLKAYGCARKILYLNKCYYNYWIHESTMRKYLENSAKKYALSLESIHNYVDVHYGNNNEFQNNLMHTDIAYFSYFVIQDYCHRNNQESYKVRKERFREDISQGSFRRAFKKANLSCLPFRRRLIAKIIRSENFFVLNATCRLNDIWNYFAFNNEK